MAVDSMHVGFKKYCLQLKIQLRLLLMQVSITHRVDHVLYHILQSIRKDGPV